MGARPGADHPVQANPLQRPWLPRPLVHDVLWPSLARRIRRVARFGREVNRLEGNVSSDICQRLAAGASILEMQKARRGNKVGGSGKILCIFAAWGRSDRTDPLV